MGNISGVAGQLKKELKRAQQEVQRFTAALAALGSSSSNGNRRLSASARKKISLAQKARWAKANGQAAKPKRTISAAGRSRIATAQRARWATIRAAKKKAA
jgi:outer membrane PBP1 activator LpoA protein